MKVDFEPVWQRLADRAEQRAISPPPPRSRAERRILALLADKAKHTLAELRGPNEPPNTQHSRLKRMAARGLIVIEHPKRKSLTRRENRQRYRAKQRGEAVAPLPPRVTVRLA